MALGIAAYDRNMSTLVEIEAAVRGLPPNERQQLLLLVAQSLRDDGAPLPEPRKFTSAQMAEWMDEDEQDMKRIQGER